MGKVTANLANLEKLSNRLKNADKKNLEVGWFKSAKYGDGTPVAGVAAVQEFGSPKRGIPPRPFMRPTIAEKQKSWDKLMADGARAFIRGSASFPQVLEGLGLKVEADIKNQIENGNYQPLSPVTIALRRLKNEGVPIGGATVGRVAAAIARGETGPGQLGNQSFGNKTPLQDTGYMVATVTHEVN